MDTPDTLPESMTLSQARRRIARWRRTRAHRRASMPEALWAAAVALARAHGRARTARALGLNYTGLRTRLEASDTGPSTASAPTFVEIPPGPAPAVAGCVIEGDCPHGGRLRIQLVGAAVAQVATPLARVLWRGDA